MPVINHQNEIGIIQEGDYLVLIDSETLEGVRIYYSNIDVLIEAINQVKTDIIKSME